MLALSHEIHHHRPTPILGVSALQVWDNERVFV
ncbi:MAG: hypothetical protein ACI9Z7_001115, partial [Alteromonas macleodii]